MSVSKELPDPMDVRLEMSSMSKPFNAMTQRMFLDVRNITETLIPRLQRNWRTETDEEDISRKSCITISYFCFSCRLIFIICIFRHELWSWHWTPTLLSPGRRRTMGVSDVAVLSSSSSLSLFGLLLLLFLSWHQFLYFCLALTIISFLTSASSSKKRNSQSGKHNSFFHPNFYIHSLPFSCLTWHTTHTSWWWGRFKMLN